MIPYGKQHITQEDIDEVIKVLKSEYLTSGPAVTKFEDIVKEFTGAKHAIALTNATSGLHVACLALGLKKGEIGVTVPISFLASSNCIIYCGADVKFVDIDPETVCMSPKNSKNLLSKMALQK